LKNRFLKIGVLAFLLTAVTSSSVNKTKAAEKPNLADKCANYIPYSYLKADPNSRFEDRVNSLMLKMYCDDRDDYESREKTSGGSGNSGSSGSSFKISRIETETTKRTKSRNFSTGFENLSKGLAIAKIFHSFFDSNDSNVSAIKQNKPEIDVIVKAQATIEFKYQPILHHIKPGDSIYKLAKIYHVDPQIIIKDNNITHPKKWLFVGDPDIVIRRNEFNTPGYKKNYEKNHKKDYKKNYKKSNVFADENQNPNNRHVYETPGFVGMIDFENAEYIPIVWNVEFNGRLQNCGNIDRNKYDTEIFAAADKHGIDRDWFKAHIISESCLNRKAHSSAGALGLGQIMPYTAKTECGITWKNNANLKEQMFDVDTNLDCSAKILRHYLEIAGVNAQKLGLVDQYQIAATASYNYGYGKKDYRECFTKKGGVRTRRGVVCKMAHYGDDWQKKIPKETKRFLEIVGNEYAYLLKQRGLAQRIDEQNTNTYLVQRLSIQAEY